MGFYADRIFPFLLDRATRRYREDRRTLLSRARGRVLELGVGTGTSLGDYPPEVAEVVALDPSRALLDRARRRRPAVPPVRLLEARAESLPFAAATFDTVVASLVFCTISGPDRAAREMLRVLRGDGRVLVFEHVRADEARVSRWQDRLNPFWKPVAVGCNLNRDTRSILEEAGFAFDEAREYHHPDVPALVAPTLWGVASRTGTEKGSEG